MTVWGFRSLRSRMARVYLEERGFGSGRAFQNKMIELLQPGDTFLDAGCGEAHLRRMIPKDVLYVGMDRYSGSQDNEYKDWRMRPDVLADVHCLPVRDETCSVVSLMHVLEHVPDPHKVMTEMARVLSPGGHLFLDVPFLHEIHHAPHDHFRYTPYALQDLAEKSGLDTIEIRPSGGYFRCVSHILEEAPNVVSGQGLYASLTRFLVAYPLKILGWLIREAQYPLDTQDLRQEFTAGYHCILRKPVK